MELLKYELVYSCLVFVLLIKIFSVEDLSECSKITCFNNGTPITRDKSCNCQCQPNFSGLLCEVELKSSVWPDGPYALMMPWSGCPESEAHGWGQGYINFTTVNPVEVFMEFPNASGVNIRQMVSHYDVKLSRLFLNYSLQINFCLKHAQVSSSNISDWPVSNISVFGLEDGCPDGFSDSELEIFLPNTRSWRTDGYLPYFKILNTENGTKLITKNCWSNKWSENTRKKKTKSFILYQNLDNCYTTSASFTTDAYTISICDSTTNSTNNEPCSQLQICAYNSIPEEEVFCYISEVAISKWPNVPFAMLYSGCPRYVDWSMGYIRFNTLSEVIWANYSTHNIPKYVQEMVLSGNETFHIYFCLKKKLQQSHEALHWPRGEYSILRVQDKCPDGFTPERISIALPPIRDWYAYGELPRFEMQSNGSECVIEACHHTRDHNIQVPFPKDHTYLFLKSNSSHCGMTFDDEVLVREISFDIVETSYEDLGKVKTFMLNVCEYIPAKETGCIGDEFYCGDGYCVPLSLLCDGSNDCPGGYDERCSTECHYPELTCDHDLCIPRVWQCDGFQHCYDGLDEMDNNCNRYNITDVVCFDREFECDGKCLPISWICDGVSDCADGNDEEADNCKLKCENGEFNCDYGRCIPWQWVCDNMVDCFDETDEMACSKKECSKDRFHCDEKCIPRTWICDDWDDCLDKTDETDCSLMCTPDEFYCGTSPDNYFPPVCVLKNQVCDGVSNCPNNRDENATYCSNACTPNELYCGSSLDIVNNVCVMNSKFCDGYSDCPNNRDEYGAYCSNELEPFCERELGLTDGTIEDDQISASSWRYSNVPKMVRPFHDSWCPAAIDTKPFLQIDLLSINLIGGFILFNHVILTTTNNEFFNVPRSELIGCRSFFVSHGIFQDRLRQYDDKPFEVDVSQYMEIPRRLTLLRPFLARFVRFYPISPIDDGILCLRLELIGCSVMNGMQTEHRQHDTTKPGERIDVNIEVHNYKLITTNVSPLQYTSNTVFTWNITTNHSGYLRFTFALIDLHNTSILPSSLCSEDTIIFSEDFDPITSFHNGLTPTFPTSRRSGFITFRTCKRMFRNDDIRRGFELILKREDTPTVWRYLTNDKIYQGKLFTNSLLGLTVLPKTQTWILESGSYGGLLTLLFQYFNFPVNSGNLLRMKVGRSIFEDYNNKRKPRGEIIDWNILIEAHFDEKVALPFPQGFSAVYRITTAPKYDHLIEFEETAIESSETTVLDIQKVCSKDLAKCYFLRPGTWYHDWFTEYESCLHRGHTLLNIHSRKEQLFLQSWLWYKLRDFRYSGRAKDFIMQSPYKEFKIHIGLIRYTTSTGMGDIWTDASKLSFTNWDKDQPKEPHINRCTGLRIGSTLEETKWVTSACQEPSDVGAQYYFGSVCETSFNKSAVEHTLITNMTSTGESAAADTHSLSATLHRCNSSEFVSQLVVCDGIPDCVDGSDENKCDLRVNPEANYDDFTCNNGERVSFGKVCNYVPDCLDGSDELCKSPVCGKKDFRCSSGQCIPAYLKCDAQEDCLDGSDEVLCGTCNSSVAFACDDLTCIHKSLVCNSMPDCTGGEDEEKCDVLFSSCYEYWKSGYDHDFSIQHPEYGFAECRFRQTIPNTITVSTLFDISQNTTTVSGFYRLDLNTVHLFEHGQRCHVQISVMCSLAVAEVDAYNRLFSNISSTRCSNKEYKYSFGLNENQTDIVFDAAFESYGLFYRSVGMDRLLVYHDYVSDSSVVSFVNTRPLKCVTEYMVALDEIRCGDGTTVPSFHKCLYDVNQAGVIKGCRNFKHLEDCETVACPVNYAKCPSSFCVAHKLKCDGEKNCPGGEDENECGCEQRNATVVFIYDRNMDRHRQSLLFKFARQFHSDDAKSIAISYSLKIISPSEFYYTISKQEIHPYSEVLKFSLKETIDYCCLAESMFNSIDNNKSIVVFNIEHDHDSSSHLSETVRNSSYVNHIYNVRVRTSILQRVVVRNSSRETEVIFKSWKIFGNAMPNLIPDICLEMISTNCIGHYRCSSSRICIPLNQICDGDRQCPFEDDEASCDFYCPRMCSCELYVADCRLSNFTDIDLQTLSSTMRVLDMSQNTVFSDNRLTLLKAFPFLIQLNASRCSLHSITVKTFSKTLNLLHLDLSFNQITLIKRETFSGLDNLQSIDLTGNHNIKNIEPRAFQMLTKISTLSITQTQLFEIQSNTFAGLVLKTLNISNNQIYTLHDGVFNNLSVEDINFEGNDVQNYNDQIFTGIRNVKTIRAPAFKFCCYQPSFVNEKNCFPAKDEFSSCDDLMRNSILQTLLWIIGAVSLIGNISTLIYRLIYDRAKIKSGYCMFVTHLAASDFLMGVYMVTIAIADMVFRKRYIEMDDFWRNSVWCKLAGVLATVSSETSILLMCLITIDRFLVIKFPFGQWRFNPRSSSIAVFFSWFISWTLAVLPLTIDSYFKGAFYSQSGVCLALPLSRNRRSGWLYSFLINIALNFVAFILIAIGQLFIYLEIRKTSRRMKRLRSQRRNDIGIAKNLLLVVATDFVCWFPIGIMAILAYDGFEIPGDIYAWTAVLILPINSALNPFLYTLSSLRHRKAVRNAMDESSMISKDTRALNRTMRQKVQITPTEASLVAYSIAKHLQKLHQMDLICGELITDNVLVETRAGKLQVYLPLPMPAKDPTKEKKIDMCHVGTLFKTLLNFTKKGQ